MQAYDVEVEVVVKLKFTVVADDQQQAVKNSEYEAWDVINSTLEREQESNPDLYFSIERCNVANTIKEV